MIGMQSLGTNGRFGNQMFQYATLYSLGKKLHYDIGVPYLNKSQNDYFNFCLPECFSLSAKDLSGYYFSSVYIESTFAYDPNITNIPDNTNLKGYFQTEKYFKNHKNDLVTKEFKFNDTISNKVNTLLNGRDSDLISVHMRLGDYLQFKDSHPVCSPEYYKDALQMMPQDVNIMLFSDDYKIALPFFNDLGIKVFACGTGDKFVDMCIMSKCEYHIIANSSFSWWGAWLSKSKKTIAPKQWFGTAPHMPKNWEDVYCEDWIVV